MSSSIAAIVSGILADAAKAAGEPGLATHLIGAAGDVLSASYAQELYEIAKLVRANPAMTSAFSAGTAGLYDRLKAMPEAAAFIGDGADRYRAEIVAARPRAVFPSRSLFLAGTVACLGERILAAGRGVAASELRPLYLREPSIRKPRG